MLTYQALITFHLLKQLRPCRSLEHQLDVLSVGLARAEKEVQQLQACLRQRQAQLDHKLLGLILVPFGVISGFCYVLLVNK